MAQQRTYEADVLVVGAGASGLPAAISAARAGAKVILVEEDFVVGGAPVDMYVAAFCGLPRTGFVSEVEGLLKAEHSVGPGGRFFLPSAWLVVFEQLLHREPGIEVLVGARAVDAIVSDGPGRPRVRGVALQDAKGFAAVQVNAAVTIDATGTGEIAVEAGCGEMYGRDSRADFDEPDAPEKGDDEVQLCTWMYYSQMIGDGPPFDMTRLEHHRRGVLVDGLGWFHNDPARALALQPRICLHWGCALRCEDTRNPLAIGGAQREAFRMLERDLAMLRENGYAVYLAPQLGVRESRRIIGEHVITENDLMSGRLPEDFIAVGTYGLDIWGGKGKGETLIRRTPKYGIPYRALLPRDADGLIVAGKAISGTHIAMSAYRVMPILGQVGQAAGVAAALCVRNGCQPRDIDAAEVRRILTAPPHNVQPDCD